MTPIVAGMAAEDPSKSFVAKRVRRSTVGVVASVRSVHAFFEQEREQGQHIALRQVQNRLAQAFGLSVRSIGTCLNSEISNFPDDKEPEVRSPSRSYGPLFLPKIRELVRLFYARKDLPTLTSLFAHACTNWTDEHAWVFGRTTFCHLLREAGFIYTKRSNHYDRVKVKLSMVNQQTKYIREVRSLRTRMPIFKQDETWLTKNTTCDKVWALAPTDGSSRVPLAELEVPSGKGERIIISHVGSC